MADIVWSDVLAAAPMVPTTPLATQNLWLAWANRRVNPSAFPDDNTYTIARALITAHFCALASFGTQGPTGPTSSQSEGGVSESFSDIEMPRPSALNSTNFGRQFMTLVGQSPAACVGVTTEPTRSPP